MWATNSGHLGKTPAIFPTVLRIGTILKIPRNSAVDFEQHNLLFQRLLLRYAFGYKLYKEPNRVFYNFDSTYPTPAPIPTNGSGSSVERYNFTKLDLRLSHKLNFGALGSTRYVLQVGGFLQKKNPVLMICNTLTAMQHPLQMLPTGRLTCCPTTNGVRRQYATFHLTHDFYKWGVGSWPLIKQLQGSLIAGIHGRPLLVHVLMENSTLDWATLDLVKYAA